MKKILLWIFLILSLCGCSTTANNKSMQNAMHSVHIYDDKARIYKNDVNYPTENLTNIEKFEKNNQSVERRETFLEQKLQSVQGLNYRDVHILGNIAVVAIGFQGEMDDAKLMETKKMIEQKVKQLDSQIDHVSVNTAPELYEETKDELPLDEIPEAIAPEDKAMEKINDLLVPSM